jgi:NADH dehydrogenase [ubiquinone] 1 alpha subcomplex assembly factor 7
MGARGAFADALALLLCLLSVSRSIRSLRARPQISPRAMAAWEEVARRVGAHGGGALAIDYGEEGPVAHSLQAIRQHAFVDLLDRVGSADLSAYVDFGALRLAAQGAAATDADADADGGAGADARAPPAPARVRSYGPVTQRALLGALGIEARLRALLERATDDQAEALIRGVMRLVGDDAEEAEGAEPGGDTSATTPASERAAKRVPGMGIRYKAMAIVHADLPPPVGFEEAAAEEAARGGGDAAAVAAGGAAEP